MQELANVLSAELKHLSFIIQSGKILIMDGKTERGYIDESMSLDRYNLYISKDNWLCRSQERIIELIKEHVSKVRKIEPEFRKLFPHLTKPIEYYEKLGSINLDLWFKQGRTDRNDLGLLCYLDDLARQKKERKELN